MNILFIHQNFPGQFKHLAPALAAIPGNKVLALTITAKGPSHYHGVEMVRYALKRGTTKDVHPWVSDIETKVIRGEACFHAALALKERGFTPDVIIAHHGWGESLFIKEVWPEARLALYCEFYYNLHGQDVGFDPEFAGDDKGAPCRLRMKNANNHLHFDIADAGISPTHWQASTFPEPFRSRIAVIHEGIDTDYLAPNSKASISINNNIQLTKNDEVITFVNRELEPTRGYHIFMRALPELLRQRPQARVMIVGGDGVSYGAKNDEGRSWKQKFIAEVRPHIPDEDWARVHFVGKVPYREFVALLQISTVHVYLTYPFVLSWSLLEAMSIGCAIVASDTNPLHEAIKHNETGRLVNFFEHEKLASEVVDLLEKPAERARLGANARAFAIATYDLKSQCLPRQLEWVKSLAPGKDESANPEPGMDKPLNIVGLGLKKFAGVTEARIDYPLTSLNTLPGVRCIWSHDGATIPDNWQPGILILHRKFMNKQDFIKSLDRVVAKGWLLVSDMDDDPHHWREFIDSDFLAYRGVHAVTVSTEPLKQMIRQWNPHVQVFPNAIFEMPRVPGESPKKAGVVRIFFGALNRDKDWGAIHEGISQALATLGKNVECVVVHDRAFYDQLPSGTLKEFHPTLPHARYMQVLATCDIALLPLADTPFNRMKSDLKFIESCAAGAVPICSPVVYGDNPAHKNIGVFAANPEEWRQAIVQLCANTHDLKQRRERGLHYVQAQRMHSQQAPVREQFYRQLLKNREQLEAERRKRLGV